jgi:hypothetical protein
MSISIEAGSFHPLARLTAWKWPLFAHSGRNR